MLVVVNSNFRFTPQSVDENVPCLYLARKNAECGPQMFNAPIRRLDLLALTRVYLRLESCPRAAKVGDLVPPNRQLLTSSPCADFYNQSVQGSALQNRHKIVRKLPL